MELPMDDDCEGFLTGPGPKRTRKIKRANPVKAAVDRGLPQPVNLQSRSCRKKARRPQDGNKSQSEASDVILPGDDIGLEELMTDACCCFVGKKQRGAHPAVLLVNPSPPLVGRKEALTEFFSPPRFVPVCVANGLPASLSWDLEFGWDANLQRDRDRAWKALDEQDPLLTTMSPECTMFSILQTNVNIAKMNPEVVERRVKVAIEHMKYCAEIARSRSAKGRKFLLEHPSGASSWKLPCIQALCRELPNCRIAHFAQCRYGLKSPAGKPIQKLTKFLTNCDSIFHEFNGKGCQCEEEHQVIQGSVDGIKLSKWAQVYPKPLVQAVVDCCRQEVAAS